MSSIYSALKIFLKGVTASYFRNIHVTGLENIPKEGPMILCCNHANQFMDAMLVIANCTRQLSFCFAASSFSKPLIGYFAKKISVIPVYRPEDSKLLGKGKVKLISETDILGIKTKFLSDVKGNKNFTLGLSALLVDNKYKLVVEKVIDETHIKVRSDPKLYEILTKNEMNDDKHKFYFIPKTDNSRMYTEAYSTLHEGRAICIFPEGTSHDRTHFLQLKAGVAYMALGAMQKHGTKGIKLISCGLTYFNRDQFRSDVIIEFGKPFEISEEYGNLFNINKKDAVERILKVVENQMTLVTLTAPSYKDYMCLKIASEIYVSHGSGSDPEHFTEVARRMSKLYYSGLKDIKEIKSLFRRLSRYIESLENLGFEDSDLTLINFNYKFLVKKTIISFTLFHVYLILAFPLCIITLPFIWFIIKKTEIERINALAKNPNKVQAKDVVSSVKVTSFVKYLPLIFILWISLCYLIVNYFVSKYTKINYSFWKFLVISSVLGVVYFYFCILMIDAEYFYLQTMKTRFFYFCFPKNVYRLINMRNDLRNEINKIINENIIGTEYENNRIIKLSSNINNNINSNIINEEDKMQVKGLKSFLSHYNLNS